MEEELNRIRQKWADLAYGLETIEGKETPSAKALRMCIGDVAEVMFRHGLHAD